MRIDRLHRAGEVQGVPDGRLIHASSGRVRLPTEVFHAVLGGQEGRRKGGTGSTAEKKR